MVAIPKQNKVTTLSLIDSAETQSSGRHYLGMSGLGEKCWRKLQYDTRNCSMNTIPARIQRIFDTGHRAEEFMVADLRKVGIKVWDCLADQKEYIVKS